MLAALFGPCLGAVAACMQFAVQYEHRASTELKRMDVINAFVEHVPKVRHLPKGFGEPS